MYDPPPFFPLDSHKSREGRIKALAADLRNAPEGGGLSHQEIADDLTRFMGDAVTSQEVQAALGE